MPALADPALGVAVTAGLVWSAIKDVRTSRIPRSAGYGILAAGLISLAMSRLWLASAFYVAAIWASGGGPRRLPMMVFAIPLFFRGSEMIAFVVGLLFVLAIFDMGWLGGGDAQLAFGLIAIGRDLWMIVYLLGGTILLAAIIVTRDRGLLGAAKRFRWVITNLDGPDKEAIRIPWSVIAAVGGTVHFWLYPGIVSP